MKNIHEFEVKARILLKYYVYFARSSEVWWGYSPSCSPTSYAYAYKIGQNALPYAFSQRSMSILNQELAK